MAIKALLPVLLCAVLFAQEQRESRVGVGRAGKEDDTSMRRNSSAPRPLNLSEGLAILGAALDSRRRDNSSSDCSHLVQDIYERAGFPYTYVSSSDLYDGVDEFRRVANPQPGDLAVWRGHAGIVVNPAQHSFFSLLSSGRGVDVYDSPYWKQRGKPRFYRYLSTSPADLFSGSVGGATLTSTALEVRPNGRPVPDSSPAERKRSNGVGMPEGRPDSQALAVTALVPVLSSHKPSPDQVSAVLPDVFKNSEQTLRGSDWFTLGRALTVFDRFSVRGVHISGNQGWAEVQIHEVTTLPPRGAKVGRFMERQRWPLRRRDKSGWDLTLPQDTVYLPLDVATRMLAHELADLTDRNPDVATTEQETHLTRLLGSLLDYKPSSATH